MNIRMLLSLLLPLLLLASPIIIIVDAYSSPSSSYILKLQMVITGYNKSDGMFNTPYGAVIDGNGRIIVTDNLNNRIQVFDSNGRFLFKFGIPGYDPGGFTHPSGVAVNSKGDIVVADLHNYRIQVFDNKGTYKLQFGKASSYDGQFTYPISVAVDSRDRIIVVDTYVHRVQVFDSNGNFLFNFGKEGSNDGEFSFPTGVAVDSRDRIIVADVWNNRIQVFDSNGNFLFNFGKEGSDDGEFSFPTGVAARGDMLAVVDTGNNRVQVFKIIMRETELSKDEGRSSASLQLLDGNDDGIIDVGQSIRAIVHSDMSDGNARFIWMGPDGSIARDTTRDLSNGIVEDEFAPSIEGVWRVEVELSNGSKIERLNATVTVIPEFPFAPPILAGLIAIVLALFYRRVEKTKFT